MFDSPERCPKCNCAVVFASKSGWVRPLAAFVLYRPFRCDHCQHRFWQFSTSAGVERPPAPPGRAARGRRNGRSPGGGAVRPDPPARS